MMILLWQFLPTFDLTSLSIPSLTFWYAQASFFDYQDEFKVLYRENSISDWNELAYFNEEQTEWTNASLILPNPSSEYQIAFEGNCLGGKGICIDYVTISESTNYC
jgi:hypothetical protein